MMCCLLCGNRLVNGVCVNHMMCCPAVGSKTMQTLASGKLPFGQGRMIGQNLPDMKYK